MFFLCDYHPDDDMKIGGDDIFSSTQTKISLDGQSAFCLSYSK